jgi:hypothetical protein
MILLDKNNNIKNLIIYLDNVLNLNNVSDFSDSNSYSLYKIKKELYYLSTHRYIDGKNYLNKLEVKFLHYLQILTIKPFLCDSVYLGINLKITDVKKIIQTIKILQNDFIPFFYKKFICYSLVEIMARKYILVFSKFK